MALKRIQASDFQAGDMKSNFSRLETLARFASTTAPNMVDIVGDVFDTHILEEIISTSPNTNTKSLLNSKPEINGILQKRNAVYGALAKKYGKKLDPKNLAPEEIESIQGAEAELANSGLAEAQAKDLMDSIARYYGECARILGAIKSPCYYIRGNNDTSFMQNIIKGIYPELEGRLVEDGPFRIIGINNTNYPQEDVLAHYLGSAHVPPDWKGAYEKYSVSKTGKKANIIMMHGPPNGFRDGHDEKDGEGITRLIKEHTPDQGFLLVECGHFHKAMLQAVKSKDGKSGYVIARSSPNIFFEHEFDDNGNYVSSEIYRYN